MLWLYMLSKTIMTKWREVGMMELDRLEQVWIFYLDVLLYAFILFPCFSCKVLEDRNND